MNHRVRSLVAYATAALFMNLSPVPSMAANHREAPITALDRLADITDWYTFVSYNDPSKVIMILNVDPLLEPSNGPNYFPFDPAIAYDMNIDNNNDGEGDDIVFRFRFTTENRAANALAREILKDCYK